MKSRQTPPSMRPRAEHRARTIVRACRPVGRLDRHIRGNGRRGPAFALAPTLPATAAALARKTKEGADDPTLRAVLKYLRERKLLTDKGMTVPQAHAVMIEESIKANLAEIDRLQRRRSGAERRS